MRFDLKFVDGKGEQYDKSVNMPSLMTARQRQIILSKLSLSFRQKNKGETEVLAENFGKILDDLYEVIKIHFLKKHLSEVELEELSGESLDLVSSYYWDTLTKKGDEAKKTQTL